MRFKYFSRLLILTLACAPVLRAPAAELPGFTEVYSLVRSNLVGMTAKEVDQSAVRGLLEQLSGRAVLVTNLPNTASQTARIDRANVYEDYFGYFRVQNLTPGTAEAFTSVLHTLTNKSKLEGIVLDLRFAQGQDYAAAAAMANLFIAEGQALLEAGDQRLMATKNKDALTLPVVVLVNKQTAGGPEAVAAILRQANVALILGGSNSAGQAYLFQDFNLSNGQTLKLAATPVKLAKGAGLGPEGVKPDITIPVTIEDEKLYFEDAYRVLPGTITQTSSARRLTEAELVRQHRESGGQNEVSPDAIPAAAAPKPVLRDPALGRALDLLKGLAVVKKLQPR